MNALTKPVLTAIPAIKVSEIDRIEKAINDHAFGEPVLAVRIYARTTSKPHVEAGAPYRLHMSFNTRSEAEKWVIDETTKQIIEEDMIFETFIIRS